MTSVDEQSPTTEIEPQPSSPLRLLVHPVTVATLIILALGGYSLGQRSLGMDESISAGLGFGSWSAWYTGVAEDGGSQSLYFLLVRVFSVFGESPFIVRLPALLGAAAVPFPLWRFVEPRLGRGIAVRSLILTAVASSFIVVAQEARAYTVLTAVLCWCWYLMDRALTAGGYLRWMAFGLMAAVSLYAQPLGFSILVAIGLWALIRRAEIEWPQAIVGAGVAGVAALPIAYLMAFEAVDHTEWLGTFSVSRFAELLFSALGQQQVRDAVVMSGMGAVLIAGLVLVALFDRSESQPSRSAVSPFILWAVVPILVLLAGSWSRAYFLARYAVPLVPAVMVLASVGLESMKRIDVRLARLSFAVLALVLVTRTVTFSGHELEPWDEIQVFVAAASSPDDVIAFEPTYAQAPFEYYTWLHGDTETMARPMAPAIGWTAPRHPNIEEYPTDLVPAPDGSLWVVVRATIGMDEVPAILARVDGDMVEVDRWLFDDTVLLRYEQAG